MTMAKSETSRIVPVTFEPSARCAVTLLPTTTSCQPARCVRMNVRPSGSALWVEAGAGAGVATATGVATGFFTVPFFAGAAFFEDDFVAGLAVLLPDAAYAG